MQKAYDPAHTLTYGYWTCPTCESSFYGGGVALHNNGCTEEGYSACVYHFGPEENTRWLGAVVTEEEKLAAQLNEARAHA